VNREDAKTQSRLSTHDRRRASRGNTLPLRLRAFAVNHHPHRTAVPKKSEEIEA